MNLPVAILAGGLGTRLGTVTERVPKCLLEVAGLPFAAHQIELLRDHDIRNIVLLVGHMGEMVRDVLGDGSRWCVHLRYVFDGPRLLGTGGAIRNALRELGPEFFVLYGDSYLPCNYPEVARAFSASGKSALMTVCRNANRWDRSNVFFSDGRILQYSKESRLSTMRHIDYGLGVFKASAFESDDGDLPLDLATVYQRLLANEDLAGFEIFGRFYEIGSPRGLEQTRDYLCGKR